MQNIEMSILFIKSIGNGIFLEDFVDPDFTWTTNSGKTYSTSEYKLNIDSFYKKTINGIIFIEKNTISAGSEVAIEMDSYAELTNKTIYTNPYCFILRFRDMKIFSVMEYGNTVKSKYYFT